MLALWEWSYGPDEGEGSLSPRDPSLPGPPASPPSQLLGSSCLLSRCVQSLQPSCPGQGGQGLGVCSRGKRLCACKLSHRSVVKGI